MLWNSVNLMANRQISIHLRRRYFEVRSPYFQGDCTVLVFALTCVIQIGDRNDQFGDLFDTLGGQV